MKAPPTPSPIEDLISDRRSLFIMMLFLTVFGPVFEELVFRGFLFPLLARTSGAVAGNPAGRDAVRTGPRQPVSLALAAPYLGGISGHGLWVRSV